MNSIQDDYDPDEIGNEDGFAEAFGGDRMKAAYTGKSYGFGATELISMGLEQLHDNPASLVAGKTDYLTFTVSLPTTADTTFQGLSAPLSLTFTGTQRNGTAR